MADTSSMRADVAAAFDAVRGGDSSRTGKLVKYGDKVIPAIAPLLKDADASVRLEAIAILDALDSKRSAEAAIGALNDTASNIGQRAARLVYRAVMRHGADDFPGLSAALTAPSAAPAPDAARLLLLAFAPGGEVTLRTAVGSGSLVKLSDGGPAVEAALPADIALSRLGVGDARSRLLDRIGTGNAADLEFLLVTIGMIDAPEILHALAALALGDGREVGGGMPAGVSPARRMTDNAVEAFITRLDLQTGIKTAPVKRYSPEEIDRVRKAVSASIPH